jgi:lipid II:glycine glycyltransferase (peptidoglycan interpeptide bridge formation enzyme)
MFSINNAIYYYDLASSFQDAAKVAAKLNLQEVVDNIEKSLEMYKEAAKSLEGYTWHPEDVNSFSLSLRIRELREEIENYIKQGEISLSVASHRLQRSKEKHRRNFYANLS